jgi:hypothetical protein
VATEPPIQSIYRLVLQQQYVERIQFANTFHVFSRTSIPGPAAVGSDFVSNVFPTWRLRSSGNVTFVSLLTEEFIPDPTQRTVHQINQFGQQSFPVGQAAILQPAVLACVITWRSGFPGKRGRGRMYYLGNWVLNSDGLIWHQSNIDNVAAIATALSSHYNGTSTGMGLQLGVFSRSLGGRAPPYSADGIHKTLAFTVQPAYSTMGSRRLGRGS